MLTFESWLPVLRPYLATYLVRDDASRRLASVARFLPGDGLGAFEVRLAEGESRVDFAVRVATRAQAWQVAEHLPLAHLREFFERWADGDPLLEEIHSFWVEFDLEQRRGLEHGEPQVRLPEVRLPEVRLPEVRLPEPLVCARPRGTDPRWLLDTVLTGLHGRPLSDTQRRLAEHCLGALPEGAKVLYLFSLLGRPGNAVRLELYGLEPSAMVPYLRKAVSAETADRIEALSPVAGGADRYHLSFDLDEEKIASRVGVEISFLRLPHREPRWRELFDRLVDVGWCDPARRDAVLDWPGQIRGADAETPWPAELDRAGFGVRALSHVKLISLPDREPEAKAYLLFQYLERGR